GKRSADSSGCCPRKAGRWIVTTVPCNKSRRDASRAARLARGHLRPDPGHDVEARRVADRADVSVSPGEPSGVLPVVAGGPACGGRDEDACRDSTDRAGASAPVWLSADHGGTAPAWAAGGTRAGGAADE